MLASAVHVRLERNGVPWIGTDLEIDIGDPEALAAFAERHRPSHIVNCAAYTRVDDAEKEPELAQRANAQGPANLGQLAAQLGLGVLHFSTDYVFDGRASEPYPENAPGAPTSIYGKSKFAGERALLETLTATSASAARRLGHRVHIVRTSWLFGEGGGNFVTTMLRLLAERETLRVVDDQHGRPTYTCDLAEAALEIAGLLPDRTAVESGIYHFANATPTTWCEFARQILRSARQHGFPLRAQTIEPITTAQYPRPAPRPSYSVLDTTRIERILGRAPRHWGLALDEYLGRIRPSMAP
jgi:dTDP-4-dehydrorhamnose reductase